MINNINNNNRFLINYNNKIKILILITVLPKKNKIHLKTKIIRIVNHTIKVSKFTQLNNIIKILIIILLIKVNYIDIYKVLANFKNSINH